jgi:hypothetical protein
MSESRGALSYCNILDIINSNNSRDNAENRIEFINTNKDTILLLVNSS